MKIAAIVGSNRKESYNKMLLEYIEKTYEGNDVEIDVITINDITMYNQDHEENPPKAVMDLKAKINTADAVIIATPEYNYSIPGVLKNVIDWFSRGDRVLNDKPTLVLGVSASVLGSVRGQAHLREILNSVGVNAHLLRGNEFYLGLVQDKFDASGSLVDEKTKEILDNIMKNFFTFVKDTNK